MRVEYREKQGQRAQGLERKGAIEMKWDEVTRRHGTRPESDATRLSAEGETLFSWMKLSAGHFVVKSKILFLDADVFQLIGDEIEQIDDRSFSIDEHTQSTLDATRDIHWSRSPSINFSTLLSNEIDDGEQGNLSDRSLGNEWWRIESMRLRE